MEKKVKTIGEAISVLIQVAYLAQTKGILSLDDAVIVKSAIDLIQNLKSNEEKESVDTQLASDTIKVSED